MAVGAEFTTVGHADTSDGAGTHGRMSYRVAEVGSNYSVVELTSVTGNARFFTRASWRFDLDQIPEGTLVTSYYDWSRIDPVWKERGIFPILSETNLRATLGILARTVAPGVPRPIP